MDPPLSDATMLQWLNMVTQPDLLAAGLSGACAAAIITHRATTPNTGRFIDLTNLPPVADDATRGKIKIHLRHLQQNWVKGVLCLREAVRGLPSFIEENGRAMMTEMLTSSPPGFPSWRVLQFNSQSASASA